MNVQKELGNKSKYVGGVDIETGKILYSSKTEKEDKKKEQEREEIKYLISLEEETLKIINFLEINSGNSKNKEKRKEIFSKLVELYKQREYEEDIKDKNNLKTYYMVRLANLIRGAITQAAYYDSDLEIKDAAIKAFDIIRSKEGLNKTEKFLEEDEIKDYEFNLRWSLNRLNTDDEMERWIATMKLKEIFQENKYPLDKRGVKRGYVINGEKIKLTDGEIVKAELVRLAKDDTSFAVKNQALEALRGVKGQIVSQESLNEKIRKYYQKNPLTIVESYIPFDPEERLEEVKRDEEVLRDLIATKRRNTMKERMEEYKRELNLQKENIGNLQKELFEEIRKDPDKDFNDLLEIVIQKAPIYKLTRSQLEIFSSTLAEYSQKHNNIKKARREFPDERDIFEACFGKKPKGEIQIVEGPMNLYFLCRDPEDFLLIYCGNFDDPEYLPTEKEKKGASVCIGYKTSGSKYPGLEGLLNAQKGGVFINEETFQHEEQHTLNTLFREKKLVSQIKKMRGTNWWETGKSNIRNIAERYLRLNREIYMEPKAKDEFLAYYKNGIDADYIARILINYSKEDRPYDYFTKISPRVKHVLAADFDVTGRFGEELVSKVFIEGYDRVLHNAAEAIKMLTKFGYDQSQIIALLSVEPLSRWNKVVNRLVGHNKGIEK